MYAGPWAGQKLQDEGGERSPSGSATSRAKRAISAPGGLIGEVEVPPAPAFPTTGKVLMKDVVKRQYYILEMVPEERETRGGLVPFDGAQGLGELLFVGQVIPMPLRLLAQVRTEFERPPPPPGDFWTAYQDPVDGAWWYYEGPLGRWFTRPRCHYEVLEYFEDNESGSHVASHAHRSSGGD